MKLFFFACLLFFNGVEVQNKSIESDAGQTGIVIKIIDGDTFDLLTKSKHTMRVRMNGIDCPERRQDFYKVSKDALAEYIYKKEVRVVTTGHDRNKRTIALVYCNEENINLAMIQNGYAWHYKKYSVDSVFAKAESQARMAKKGLWKINQPVPPWEFRKKKARFDLQTGPE
ncbi:MAG: thermonuclease family protein [Chitinophagaceae bacterium]